MRDKNPFSFIIGLIIFFITAAAVIQFMAHPARSRRPAPYPPARVKPQAAVISPRTTVQPGRPIPAPAPVMRRVPAPAPKTLPAKTPVSVPVVPAIPPSEASPEIIAIVIDDWGYTLNTLPITRQIHYPITAAVLPRLAHSREVAQELKMMGHEVILHLPMEPKEKVKLEKETVTTQLTAAQINAILNKDLANLKYAQGVSNHMGSKATQDERVMSTLLKELKRRDLYFLDSYVVPESIGPRLAQTANVPCIRRDVFLDNKLDPEYIRRQIELLQSRAKENGYAVGIGHDRTVTLEVLREEMPKMARAGYRFVKVSELLRDKPER